MSACTFFGHRECPKGVRPALRAAIERLITDRGVDTFYVGNHGQFDADVRGILRKAQREYPQIRYAVILAYLPTEQKEDYSDTVYPEGLEIGLPRFAVERRNRWMLERADYVICYVRYPHGGACKFCKMASRQGKKIINLCQDGVSL